MERNNGIPVIGVSRHRLGTDGNGVTTLVAFHGCKLRCKYCLNPEAIGSAERLRWKLRWMPCISVLPAEE